MVSNWLEISTNVIFIDLVAATSTSFIPRKLTTRILPCFALRLNTPSKPVWVPVDVPFTTILTPGMVFPCSSITLPETFIS